jgi:hypothetical protein
MWHIRASNCFACVISLSDDGTLCCLRTPAVLGPRCKTVSCVFQDPIILTLRACVEGII